MLHADLSLESDESRQDLRNSEYDVSGVDSLFFSTQTANNATDDVNYRKDLIYFTMSGSNTSLLLLL